MERQAGAVRKVSDPVRPRLSTSLPRDDGHGAQPIDVVPVSVRAARLDEPLVRDAP